MLDGPPLGGLPLTIFDAVFRCPTVRGSLAGARADMKKALTSAAEGKVKTDTETTTVDDVIGVPDRLRTGKAAGRVVLRLNWTDALSVPIAPVHAELRPDHGSERWQDMRSP